MLDGGPLSGVDGAPLVARRHVGNQGFVDSQHRQSRPMIQQDARSPADGRQNPTHPPMLRPSLDSVEKDRFTNTIFYAIKGGEETDEGAKL